MNNDDIGKSRYSRPNRNLYKIVPVRLPVDKWDLFSREADNLGVGASTLARIWILDTLRKLHGNNGGNGSSPEESKAGSARKP